MKILHKIFSSTFRARYFTPWIVFVKNTRRKNYPHCGKNVDLIAPLYVDPNLITLEDYTRLQSGVRIISSGGHVIVRKYSAIGADTLIVPGNHTPTVGLPQYLSTTHINDKETTIIIEEDCWIGARSILLSHCHVGRGAIVAAGTTVTKEVPPYAVVAGNPGKIIATRFSLEQILAHEEQIYPEDKRMSRTQLEEIFTNHFEGKKAIGTSDISEANLQTLLLEKQKIGITQYGK